MTRWAPLTNCCQPRWEQWEIRVWEDWIEIRVLLSLPNPAHPPSFWPDQSVPVSPNPAPPHRPPLPPLQEEVTSLHTKVQEANSRLEAVKTQLSTEHLRSTHKLQQRNDSLQEDLRATEQLNLRLSDRQNQLVSLQTAVLELWGRCQVRLVPKSEGAATPCVHMAHSRYRYMVLTCLNAPRPAQEDPAFLAANNGDRPESLKAQHQADHPGSEADGGLNLMRDMDPLAVLALVKEYVIARSAKLSSRHYLDAQRVANRVWSKHFRHKVEMRGKVSRRHHSLIILPWSGCSIYTGCGGALGLPSRHVV